MSTKIFNGLILRNSSLETALDTLKLVRQKCIPVMKAATAKQIAKRIALKNDMRENYILIEKKTEYVFASVLEEFHEAERTVKGRGTRNTTWDATFDICLIPDGRDILALSYFENNKEYASLLEEAGFEDYSYQNSTDKPESISEKEWDERHDRWKAVLPRSATPCEVGFTYSVIHWDDIGMVFFNADIVMSAIPSEEKRKKSVATRLCEIEHRREEGTSLMDAVDEILKLSEDRAKYVRLAKSAI